MNASAERIGTLLLERFAGRTDCYLSEKRENVKEAPTLDVIAAHLYGRDRIGLFPNGNTSYLGFDFDGKNLPGGADEAFRQVQKVDAVLDADLGFPPGIVELTRSGKGYRVIVFYDPSNAPTVAESKAFGLAVLRAAGLPDDEDERAGHVGVYPFAPGPKGFGKTAYMPLGGVLNGGVSRFLDPVTREPLDRQETPLEEAQLVTRDRVLTATKELHEAEVEAHRAKTTEGGTTVPPTSHTLTRPKDAARHDALWDRCVRWARLGLGEIEVRTFAFKLADDWGMLAENRGGEVENIVVGAMLKAKREPDSTRVELPPEAIVRMAAVVAKMPSYAAGSIVRDIGLHLWWSRPGNLKTYLAILLVLYMTQRKAGDMLFGLIGLPIIRPWKKVLWLGDEETAEEWKARAEAVARGNGLNPPGDEVVFADASGGPCLLNLDHIPGLLDLAGPDVSAVVADPLANLGPDKDADGRPVKVDLDNPHALHRVCRPLRRLAKQREVAIFLLHHANSTGERERGPTAYRGSSDVVAELKFDSDVLTLIDHKNRDRRKGRFSFRPVWEDLPAGLSVRFEPSTEPVATAAMGLKGAARAMYAAAQAGAGHLTHAEIMRTKIPGNNTEDVSSRTKRRAWNELVEAKLVCEDKGVVRLLSQVNRTGDDSDTSGHDSDTGTL